MSKKQWFLTFFSIKRKIFKKSFVISNVILALLISVAANMDTIIKSFGGDFEEPYTIYYVDEFENQTFDIFEAGLNNGFLEIENELIVINETHELVPEDDNVVVVELMDDMTAKIASNDLISNSVYGAITGSLDSIKLQATAARLELSQDDIIDLRTGVPVDRVVINDEGSTEIGGLIEEGLSVIIVMPLFLGLIMIVQMIGLEIFDEKSTKAMEVIMSNVDPKTHLKSKIISANLFSIIQLMLVATYGLFGMAIRGFSSSFLSVGQVFDISPYLEGVGPLILLVVIFFVTTNLMYSMVMAILSSTANEMDDYQKIISPLMILMLAGFYAAIFSPMFDGATFIEAMAYIPFFSLMLVPTLFASGSLGMVSVILIFMIQLLTLFAIYRLGVPVYKQSVLDYSSDNVFKRLFSNIKRSRE